MMRQLTLSLLLTTTILAAPASAQDRAWAYRPAPDPAQLGYATPDSDDLVLALSCSKDSRQLVAHFPVDRRLATTLVGGRWLDDVGRAAPWPVSVTIASGEVQTTIPGQADVDALGEGSIIQVEFADRAPVAEAFARTGQIRFSALGGMVEPPPAPRRELRSFLRYCR
ncbi:MAG: hypothetical protein Q7V15_15345 [Phenylobacterium sp.]|uniref:hypothetical protein n=1 Tax=Phenylobacterium sp. TaxID=1871053 RepID=UPI0027176205|nr:hypothetical protein [Phenylobacterium sp.]MDO8902720.1 hypothetical protein [Phenylobacterium sp.]